MNLNAVVMRLRLLGLFSVYSEPEAVPPCIIVDHLFLTRFLSPLAKSCLASPPLTTFFPGASLSIRKGPKQRRIQPNPCVNPFSLNGSSSVSKSLSPTSLPRPPSLNSELFMLHQSGCQFTLSKWTERRNGW